MGSGPACFLAGTFNPAALMIMSGYMSIKAAAKSAVGFLSFLVKERFNNLQEVQRTRCPTFILHGHQDEVIPYNHGETLFEQSVGQPKKLHHPRDMTHNDYDLNRDLLRPLR